MSDEKCKPEYVKTTVYVPKELLDAAHKASARVKARTGDKVGMADIYRWGMWRELEAIRAGEPAEPEGYPFEHGRW